MSRNSSRPLFAIFRRDITSAQMFDGVLELMLRGGFVPPPGHPPWATARRLREQGVSLPQLDGLDVDGKPEPPTP